MAASNLDLTPSLKKVERAQAKLANLKAQMVSFVASQPYAVRTELHGNMFHVIARRIKPVPESVSWELVEAVGHLRSALDKMMVALVAINGNGVSGVGFPFGGINNGKPEPFPSKRTNDQLHKKLTPDQRTLILAQKPYPGGNDLLWAVNEIANEDKHRMNLVSADVFMHPRSLKISNGIFAGGGFGVVVDSTQYNHVLHDQETETVIVSYAHGPRQPDVECSLAVSIVFGNVLPVQGKDICATLGEQIHLVKGIVELVGATFG